MAAKAGADVVIAGAGICALSAARYLCAALPPSATIVLVSQHAAASYTSSLSTECYRDHWPTAVMRDFMGHSIALLHAQAAETGDAFRVQNKGYLYVSGAADAAAAFRAEAAACHGHGAPGTVRHHTGGAITPLHVAAYAGTAGGADVLGDAAALRGRFPYLHPSLTAGLHARNAGWVSAQTMGMCMLDDMLAMRTSAGAPRVRLVRGTVTGVDTGAAHTAVRGVRVSPLPGSAAGGEPSTLACGTFVNATGPYLNATHTSMFGAAPGVVASASALPVFSEVHAKVVFRDTLGVIPRSAPMVISNDAVTPAFAPEELEFIAESRGQAVADKLASPLPPGAHFRPYGGPGSDAVLMLWEAWHHGVQPTEPPSEGVGHLLDHELYPEVVLRGLASVVPDLRAYFDEDFKGAWLAARAKAGGGGGGSGGGEGESEGKKPYVDGGYYTKTQENIPLIGPAPGAGGAGTVAGAYLCGAVSGYGIMAGHAAGHLLAQHVAAGSASGGDFAGPRAEGAGLGGAPSYARIMNPLRYQWPEFTRAGGWRDQLLAAGGGQL
jgi:glycine/D-amino acid oxidase-like deaminating enzyme